MCNVGRGSISDDLLMILTCHEMKWTYQEYLEQPDWFIKAINQKVNIENYTKNREIKKNTAQNKVKR